MKIQRAMILAAGFGQRLNPLTKKKPKPLLKINNVTLLDNTLRFLKKIGVTNIAINTHYLGHEIEKHINKFCKEYNIVIFKEKKILGTGGGILNCLSFFKNETFIVVNCDTLWSDKYKSPLNDLSKQMFKKKGYVGLLVLKKNKSFDKKLKGDFYKDKKKDGFLKRNEKKNDCIYTGCQIVNPIIFKGKKKSKFSMNLIWDEAIKKKKLISQNNCEFTKFYHVTDLKIYNKLKNLKLPNFR